MYCILFYFILFIYLLLLFIFFPSYNSPFRSNVGRRIFSSLFNTKPSEFNDLFLTGRMAYAIDLDDDVAESDIPTTVIRSKADLQGIEVIIQLF